jgi:hypothetical protein
VAGTHAKSGSDRRCRRSRHDRSERPVEKAPPDGAGCRHAYRAVRSAGSDSCDGNSSSCGPRPLASSPCAR